MLGKIAGYRYFYINEDWEYIEITKKQYEGWNTSGYWASIPKLDKQ